jgi:Zn-dependent peptidase ImmA (M78 family)
MASIKAVVKPELLAWARRSANLEPISAARKIKVPEDRIAQWESGDVAPTIAELRRAASVYNRALGVFYLSEPPQDFDTLRDFRRVGGTPAAKWSPALHAEYRRAHAQRDALLDIAELDQTPPTRGWQLGNPPDTDQTLGNLARRLLQDASPLPVPRPSSSEYEHLNYWTAALDGLGVLVMSTQGGKVDPEEMRAFSLYAEEVPVIVLNGADSVRGRLFSLMHEYAHLLLHTAGLCDTTTDWEARTEGRRLEARCNAIAAEVLMPRSAVATLPQVVEHERDTLWSLDELIEAAKHFGTSAEALLRRLVTLGLATHAEYREFRQDKPEPARKASGKGNFYYNKARDLGKGYVRTVSDAHRRSLIDTTTAATYLDVKVGQMTKLAQVAQV